MGLFVYEAMNKQAETIEGQLVAETVQAALDKVREMGLTVLELKEVKEKESGSSFFTLEKRVTSGELSLFSRQLAAMLGAGIPVTRALFTLSRQSTNVTFNRVLDQISRNVEGGMNLTDAFSQFPRVFPPIYRAMIHAGELGGILETTLTRLAEQLQKDKQIADNVKSATMYPRLLAIAALLIFTGMLVFMVPIFQGFIPDGVPVPGITQMIFGLSASIRSFWYFWILGIVAVVALVVTFMKSATGKQLWDNIKFKMPLFGQLIHKIVIARFSRTLATLLDGGIPVVQALLSAGPTSGSMLVEQAVIEATKRIEEGKSISEPLEKSGIFPPMVIHMIAVGEESGNLPDLLDKVAEFYEDEVAIMTKGLTSMIEPLMLFLVAFLVGGMLISLYLPMFTAVTNATG